MKMIWGGGLSIALLAASPNASAREGPYFFQHQASIMETAEGCVLSILYPERGPLSFEYKPNNSTVEISYQVQRAEALTGDNQSLFFILNAPDPRPDATESATYQNTVNGSVQVVDGHLEIGMTAGDSADLLEFLAKSYSISFSYHLAEGDSLEIENYDIPDIRELVGGLKKCAEAVSIRKK